MSRFPSIISLLLTLLFTAFAANSGTITGKVINAQTDQPIENANIEILDTVMGTVSDTLGEFSLTDLPSGTYRIGVTFIGFRPVQKTVNLTTGQPVFLIILLEPDVIQGESIIITGRTYANHAVSRESPVMFTRLQHEVLADEYTTGDIPDLMKGVPGIWTSSAGIGETELILRGFSSDKISFLINDIPMNNPEDQQMYWSDWAGLASITRTIEVQRGPGFSLYSPNAFGGSIHFTTMGSDQRRCTSFRISVGTYKRMGIETGPNAGKVINTAGEDLTEATHWPVNFTFSARFNSGPMYDGKLNFSFFIERKAGDSYILGTRYDGYTLGLETEAFLAVHKLRFSFFISTQSHGQAFALQDIDLFPVLGREYNRRNHTWQENFYTKPFWSLKHEWQISDFLSLTNNFFYTLGRGADQNCANDLFDVKTGIVGFQPSSRGSDAYAFGSHAQFLYVNYGLQTTDFIPGGQLFVFKNVPFENNDNNGAGINFFADQHSHSYQNLRKRDHHQLGLISIMSQVVNPSLQVDYGMDLRFWHGHRDGEMRMLKVSDMDPYRPLWSPTLEDLFRPIVQSTFNFDTEVSAFAPFGRLTWKPYQKVTLQSGIQMTLTRAEVIEDPIQLIDFGTWGYFNTAKRTTADRESFSRTFGLTNDYMRDYTYFTPWMGGNVNISDNLNFLVRFARAKKEPSILDWYDYGNGPLLQKSVYPEMPEAVDLVPETATGFEVGSGFFTSNFKIQAGYYHTIYTNKIERVVDINDRRTILNAGQALFQGIEGSIDANFSMIDASASFALAHNRWQQMNVKTIFDSDARDVIGKIVPFAPERIANLRLGIDIPISSTNSWRFEFQVHYWDEYYGTYTNTYIKFNEKIIGGAHYQETSIYSSKLPYFLDVGCRMIYAAKLKTLEYTFRIDIDNILNRHENFMRAQYSIDYTRNDFQAGRYNWYVLQAPLLNIFLTAEITLNN